MTNSLEEFAHTIAINHGLSYKITEHDNGRLIDKMLCKLLDKMSSGTQDYWCGEYVTRENIHQLATHDNLKLLTVKHGKNVVAYCVFRDVRTRSYNLYTAKKPRKIVGSEREISTYIELLCSTNNEEIKVKYAGTIAYIITLAHARPTVILQSGMSGNGQLTVADEKLYASVGLKNVHLKFMNQFHDNNHRYGKRPTVSKLKKVFTKLNYTT